MKITETKDGAVIEVYVKPNSQKFEIAVEGDEMVVRCTAEPVKGKVNKELLKKLSTFFGVKVELVSGVTSRKKLFLVYGKCKDEVERFLEKMA